MSEILIKKLFLPILIILSLGACDSRGYIRMEKPGFIGFKFFLFANVHGKKFQAGGDGKIDENTFAFRLYDNLLGKYILSFRSDFSGMQQMIIPTEKIIYIKEDKVLSLILTKYFYKIMAGELIIIRKDDTMIREEKDAKGRAVFIFTYANIAYKLTVLKIFPNGRPSRIMLSNGRDNVIFDITEYQSFGFNISEKGYSVYHVNNKKTFLEWLGEIYEGK